MEILKPVASGSPYKAIASTVLVKERILEREIRNVFNRLGANNVANTVSEAHEKGFIWREAKGIFHMSSRLVYSGMTAIIRIAYLLNGLLLT